MKTKINITKPDEHYYTPSPTSRKIKREINAIIRGSSFRFITYSGVFSPRDLDYATLLLADNMHLPEDGLILDMGSGYGPLGIVAARIRPRAKVIMADVNRRALSAARENIKLNNTLNASVVESDFFANLTGLKGSIDAIITNPPIAIGLKSIFSFIEDSIDFLRPGGSLQLVARHNKGGSRLESHMKGVCGNVAQLAKSGGFRVYMSVKRP